MSEQTKEQKAIEHADLSLRAVMCWASDGMPTPDSLKWSVDGIVEKYQTLTEEKRDSLFVKQSIERYLDREKTRAKKAFEASPTPENAARVHEVENMSMVITELLLGKVT